VRKKNPTFQFEEDLVSITRVRLEVMLREPQSCRVILVQIEESIDLDDLY
jgi:hypothetical protein